MPGRVELVRLGPLGIIGHATHESPAALDRLLHEAGDHLLGAVAGVPDVDQRVGGHAADAGPALQQDHLRAVPRRATRRRDARRAAAADHHVGLGQHRHFAWGSDDRWGVGPIPRGRWRGRARGTSQRAEASPGGGKNELASRGLHENIRTIDACRKGFVAVSARRSGDLRGSGYRPECLSERRVTLRRVLVNASRFLPNRRGVPERQPREGSRGVSRILGDRVFHGRWSLSRRVVVHGAGGVL